MKMRDKTFVLVCFSLVIFSVDITICIQNSWNWFEAQQQCSKSNDTLKTDGVILNSVEHWTGVYRRYSPWIKLLGCYDSIVVSEYSTYNFYFNITSAGFCQEICASVNSTHFGMKSGECVCFEDLVFAETISSNKCNRSCYDVENEGAIKFLECGGPNAYTLYTSEADRVKKGATCLAVDCGSVQKFSYSSDCSESYFGACIYKEYLGCFKDQPNRTLSGKNRKGDYMLTVESCRKFCTDYQFYGVEFSGECYCGNFFTSFIKKPERECNMNCLGNKSQNCGSANRINIYSNLNYETEIKTNWTSSMKICKTRSPSSYLIGNVSLTATLACKQLQRKQRGFTWLSIAKEVYTGYDRGVAVDIHEKETFHQCQKCNQTTCEFVNCFEKLDYLICEKGLGFEIPQRRVKNSLNNQGLLIGVVICGILVVILTGIVIFLIIYIIRMKRKHSSDNNKKNCTSYSATVVETACPTSAYTTLNPSQVNDINEQHYTGLSNVSDYTEIH